MKKFLSVFLVFAMVLSLAPIGLLTASAEQTGDFTYEVADGQATITGYTGAGGHVTIPGTVDGYPVKAIGDYALYWCESIISITIDNGVKSIGEGAFFGCTGATNIVTPNSVTSIGDYAFYLCYSLKTIALSDSVTSLGGSAFQNCSALTSITIPDSVTSIR